MPVSVAARIFSRSRIESLAIAAVAGEHGLERLGVAEGRGGIPCARPIARKERWPLRQHRQHRLRPYWAPAGVGASQVDSCRRKRDMLDLRAVVLSGLRAHYRWVWWR